MATYSTTPPHPSAPETAAAPEVPATDPARTTALAPRALTAFFVIAFAFSWIAWWAIPRYLLPEGANAMPAVIVGSFGPMVAAIVVTLATQGLSGVGALFRRYSPFRHRGILPYAIGVLSVAVIGASIAVPVLLYGTDLDEAGLRAALLSAPVQFLVIALAGGGNEELGWRGFALPRLQGALPPLAANVVLGGVWAVWHAPLFHLAGTVQSEMYFPAYALLCVGFTVVLGTVFNSARGGVLAAVLTHSAINVVVGLKGAAVGGPAGLGEVVMTAVVAVILIAATRGRLGMGKQRGAES